MGLLFFLQKQQASANDTKGATLQFLQEKQQQPLEIITLRQIGKQSVAHTNILPSMSLWEERDCCCIYPSGRANEGRELERRKWERVRNKRDKDRKSKRKKWGVLRSATGWCFLPWHERLRGCGLMSPYLHSPYAISAEKSEYVFIWICWLGPQFARE